MTTYKDIFGVDASGDAIQDAKHAVGEAKRLEASSLRQQAAVNRMYAEAIAQTIAETGRGSLYMMQVHESQAERKEAKAEALWRADDTADYDSNSIR